MSGSIQGLSTASMTIAAGQVGVTPISYGYYPAEGSRCVSAMYNWTSQTGYQENLAKLSEMGVETTIQAVYVDNSTNPQTVSLTMQGTGQLIIVPAGAQGIFPLLAPASPLLQISVPALSAGAVTRINYLNMPCGGSVWGASAGVSATPSPQAQYIAAPPELANTANTILQTDAYGSQAVNGEALAPVYSSCALITPVATATDISMFIGSAVKTVRLHQICLSFSATAAIPSLQVQIYKRPANSTGGGPTPQSVALHDSANAASTATLYVFGSNPALGGGLLLEDFYASSAGSASVTAGPYVFNYGQTDQSVVLRGSAQCVNVNLAGAALPAGLLVAIKMKWSEV